MWHKGVEGSYRATCYTEASATTLPPECLDIIQSHFEEYHFLIVIRHLDQAFPGHGTPVFTKVGQLLSVKWVICQLSSFLMVMHGIMISYFSFYASSLLVPKWVCSSCMFKEVPPGYNSIEDLQ
jgi:hypothetical protein